MLEKMNTKRWIAVGIAVLILGLSALSSGLSSLINREEQMKKVEESIRNSIGSFDRTVLEGENADAKIAKIAVEGPIMDIPSTPFAGTMAYDHRLTLAELDDILEDDTVKGVLLEVNSPGGGVFESAELHKKLKAIADADKTIYVSMGNMAASGGYYISAPAKKIYAAPSTITGSIGVIMGGQNLSGLLEKLGIADQAIKSAAHKDIGSTTRPMTEDERAILQGVIDDMYGEFLKVVSEGRQMDIEQVRTLADGSIYTGNQAKANGLIDEIGYPEDVLAALKTAIGAEDAQVYEYTPGLSGSIFGNFFSKTSIENEVIEKLLFESLNAGARPMYLYGGA
ncbi:Protease 4 [Aedoeadaptatus ivorii]|uniref:Protease 4 n=1 Tax=Aedoeadaptatus ivorii TaxID=54006 RepID=A0A3S5F7T5_9FIRM|nr:signal peptide peptidase SppA [Peptoniphilus ivorii]VEJ34892.1 Protease 4 [Peptoniphilus ivorii]